jgi:2-dehydro-3-deoxy-D-gluconate 5-dehydrogenase
VATSTLTERVALITGASRGIGRAISVRLAEAGATIAAVGRDTAALTETADLCRAFGTRAECFTADISDHSQVVLLVRDVTSAFGHIDILINNAGITITKAAVEVTPEEWDRIFRVNAYAPFFLCREVGPMMQAQRHGKVVNIASVLGVVGDTHLVPYAASKGALVQLTRSLAVEWAPFNIQVNAVAPAYIRTEMNDDALDDPRVMQRVLKRTPARRLGLTEEVAGAVQYLVSPDSNYITGQILAVDGGWTAQ